jgi:DNA-binding transcriptional LysR family regulator
MPRRLNLDLDLLRTFVAVAETGAFTSAGARVLRTQSAVSLQIKRLEEATGRKLIDRSPRHVALTAEGETLLVRSRDILRMNDEAVAALDAPEVTGAVSVGTPEDFATAHLPGVFAEFARAFAKVDLRVTCDLTLNLLTRFKQGEFDLVLIKREPERAAKTGSGGTRVWREPLVWVAASKDLAKRPGPLPLAVSPAPCVYRKRALDALKRSGRAARIAYECAALSGTLAAVKAGLGVTVLPRGLAGDDLVVLDDAETLPDLHDTEIAILHKKPLSAPAARLQAHMIRRLESMAR